MLKVPRHRLNELRSSFRYALNDLRTTEGMRVLPPDNPDEVLNRILLAALADAATPRVHEVSVVIPDDTVFLHGFAAPKSAAE